jgi:hypothetical protein
MKGDLDGDAREMLKLALRGHQGRLAGSVTIPEADAEAVTGGDQSPTAQGVLDAIRDLELAGCLAGANQRRIRRHLRRVQVGWTPERVWAGLVELIELGKITTSAGPGLSTRYSVADDDAPGRLIPNDLESLLELNRTSLEDLLGATTLYEADHNRANDVNR